MSIQQWDAMQALVQKINQLDQRVYELEGKFKIEDFNGRELANLPIEKKITDAVAVRFPEQVRYIGGTSRSTEFVFPRHIAMYLLYKHSRMSMPAVGRLFKKHHSSVLHAVRKIAEQRKTDIKLDSLLKSIEADILREER